MNTFSFSKAFWICERCKAPLTLFTVQQAIWRVVGSLCNHDWHCYTSAYNYEEALFAKVRLFSWDTVGLHILVLGIFLFWQTCLIFKVSDRSSKKLILFICSWKRYRWTESTLWDFPTWMIELASRPQPLYLCKRWSCWLIIIVRSLLFRLWSQFKSNCYKRKEKTTLS